MYYSKSENTAKSSNNRGPQACLALWCFGPWSSGSQACKSKMSKARVVPRERGGGGMWQQVLAEFTVTCSQMGRLSRPLSVPCKGEGGVEAQRAPARRLWSELSKEALEDRAVLARQSGHWPHHGLQPGPCMPEPRTPEVPGA